MGQPEPLLQQQQQQQHQWYSQTQQQEQHLRSIPTAAAATCFRVCTCACCLRLIVSQLAGLLVLLCPAENLLHPLQQWHYLHRHHHWHHHLQQVNLRIFLCNREAQTQISGSSSTQQQLTAACCMHASWSTAALQH
jgi:hypothetical protein